jgi:hypothetical protein
MTNRTQKIIHRTVTDQYTLSDSLSSCIFLCLFFFLLFPSFLFPFHPLFTTHFLRSTQQLNYSALLEKVNVRPKYKPVEQKHLLNSQVGSHRTGGCVNSKWL